MTQKIIIFIKRTIFLLLVTVLLPCEGKNLYAAEIIQPKPAKDFRFEQIEDAQLVLLKKGTKIREEKKKDSREVGKAEKKSVAYLLKDESDEWVYIESGRVRGFVNRKNITFGNKAKEIYKKNGKTSFAEASVVLPLYKNKAIDYTKTTTQRVVVKKIYAIAKRPTEVHETPQLTKSRTIGTMEKGAVSCILADAHKDIMYIESGDVRGFVKSTDFITGERAVLIMENKSEKEIVLAEEKIAAWDNAACYYTITSTSEADDEKYFRNSITEFAKQFVGNPYVWGGTSLTDGADCSGFIQSVYSYYGYHLPRVACEQAGCGTQIPISEAKKGDLIFYAEKDGYIYHVSMYIGQGNVVHALNSERGIVTTGIGTTAIYAVRIIG